jgi:hypothetical protein
MRAYRRRRRAHRKRSENDAAIAQGAIRLAAIPLPTVHQPSSLVDGRPLSVLVSVAAPVAVGEMVAVWVPDEVAVALGEPVAVSVPDEVAVAVAVAVGEVVAVWVLDAVAVAVGEVVAVWVVAVVPASSTSPASIGGPVRVVVVVLVAVLGVHFTHA